MTIIQPFFKKSKISKMGGINSQFANHGHLKKHQEEVCLFSSGRHGAFDTYVLYQLHSIYGESRQDMVKHTGQRST
ncbi:MAG: hypothetical protein J6R79_05785 [Bacteroidaceae bacterium]|nr:hypothetical protein [Bacteroidaceae bacterium]